MSGKVYGDTYSQTISSRVAIGSAALPEYNIQKRNNSEFNYEGRLHYNSNFGDFSLNSFAGFNIMDRNPLEHQNKKQRIWKKYGRRRKNIKKE